MIINNKYNIGCIVNNIVKGNIVKCKIVGIITETETRFDYLIKILDIELSSKSFWYDYSLSQSNLDRQILLCIEENNDDIL